MSRINLHLHSLNSFRKRRAIIFYIVVVGLGFLIIWGSRPLLWPGGFGFGANESTTVASEINPQGQIQKFVRTRKFEDGKTLWDWLSLLGVPLALLILGLGLEQLQRQRDEEAAKEEVLQTYFDRLSTLLIEQNIFAIAAKVNQISEGEETEVKIYQADTVSPEQQALFNAGVDVIRARTLSILRRFENDSERKTSVIRFLLEAEIISKLYLSLSGAELDGVDLRGVKLGQINLSGAKLSEIKLSKAQLNGANLSGANLSGADLSWSELSFADLRLAKLGGANLSGVNLIGARLGGAELYGTNLIFADLKTADLKDIKYNDDTNWPDGVATVAKNISNELNHHLCSRQHKDNKTSTWFNLIKKLFQSAKKGQR